MSGECDKCGEHALECNCEEMNDFISRAHLQTEEARKEAHKEQLDRIRKWNDENRTTLRESIRKYSKTEKGAFTCSKRNHKRRKRMWVASKDIEKGEKLAIGRFYLDCPEGYEVDHIIPIAKGGRHCIGNLQYLKKEENRRKSAKLPNNFSEYLDNLDHIIDEDAFEKETNELNIEYATNIDKNLPLETYCKELLSKYEIVLKHYPKPL